MGLYAELTAADLALPQQPVALPPQGLLDQAQNFIVKNTGSIVNILDAAGRLRQSAKIGETAINDAYYRNITLPPAVSWFDRETIAPGFSNGLVTMGAALLMVGTLLLVMKPRGPQ